MRRYTKHRSWIFFSRKNLTYHLNNSDENQNTSVDKSRNKQMIINEPAQNVRVAYGTANIQSTSLRESAASQEFSLVPCTKYGSA